MSSDNPALQESVAAYNELRDYAMEIYRVVHEQSNFGCLIDLNIDDYKQSSNNMLGWIYHNRGLSTHIYKERLAAYKQYVNPVVIRMNGDVDAIMREIEGEFNQEDFNMLKNMVNKTPSENAKMI